MFSQTILNLDYIFVFILFVIYCQVYVMVLHSSKEAKKKKKALSLIYFLIAKSISSQVQKHRGPLHQDHR